MRASKSAAVGCQYGEESADFTAENLIARERFADCGGKMLELEEVLRLAFSDDLLQL